MELIIKTQMNPGILPEIQWNNEELKKEIGEKAAEYKNTAYTSEQSTEMRKDRAKLNALVTAFEDQRKQVKRFYNEPYTKFEEQVKEVLSPAREAIQLIDQGLDEIEQKYRSEKKKKMQAFYELHAGELKELVPFERTVREEFFKRAFTDKKLEQAYLDLFARIREDISNIEDLDSSYKDKILLEYAKNLSLGDALREGKRLEELEKLMEQRRQKQEEQRQQAEQSEPEVQNSCVSKEPEASPKNQQSQILKDQGPVLKLDFRVWGTREQLMALRDYMINNGIKFGKVE